jgi:hypothetical protein
MALLAQVSTQKLLTTVIQASSDIQIQDNYKQPGYLTTGFLTLAASSTTEAYTLTNNSFVTGKVSSLGLSYFNDPDFQTGSLYLSSLYLGNVGGSVKGQLTTDDTASDVYWNGTSLTSGGGGGGITALELTSTTIGLGSLDYISSASLASSLISTIEIVAFALADTVANLGTYGYVSTLDLTSTVEGLGSLGYISTGGQGVFSTVFINMLPQDAPFWDPKTFPSQGFDPEPNPLALDIFGSARILKNLYIGSTTTIIGSSGIVTPQVSSPIVLTSSLLLYDPTTLTVLPISLSNGSLLINGSNIVTTSNGSVLDFLSTPNLISTVAGLGQRYLSTIPSVLSTSQLFTSSAVISTGTFNTVSTLHLNASTVTATQITTSTIATNGITIATNPSWILTSPIQTLAVSTNTVWAEQGYITTGTLTTGSISTLTTNAVTLGAGATWILTSPIQTSVLSSIFMYANNPFFDTVNIGSVSTMNSLEFYGTVGNYNNTVLAEISTGAGTQELLVFKGSSVSDRVRVQTTGTFVVETGVSARLFNSNTTQTLANATPALIINTSSNVGIQTANPQTTLDVAGTGRFVTLSSMALFASSIVAPYTFRPQFFTF